MLHQDAYSGETTAEYSLMSLVSLPHYRPFDQCIACLGWQLTGMIPTAANYLGTRNRISRGFVWETRDNNQMLLVQQGAITVGPPYRKGHRSPCAQIHAPSQTYRVHG